MISFVFVVIIVLFVYVDIESEKLEKERDINEIAEQKQRQLLVKDELETEAVEDVEKLESLHDEEGREMEGEAVDLARKDMLVNELLMGEKELEEEEDRNYELPQEEFGDDDEEDNGFW